MEKVNSRGDLRQVLAQLDKLPHRQRQVRLRQRIDQLARLVRELHLRNLAHRDLKAANILLDADKDSAPEPPAERPNPFCFIDLVGVSRRRWLRQSTRIKNLARLHASFYQDSRLTRTDKLRFLHVYLQCGLFGRENWKDWWRGIDAATQIKVRKNQRNQRPLA
jgi:serine/threonine protein kinase